MPAVILMVALLVPPPVIEHTPETVIVTSSPELADAATLKLVLYAALAGAGVPKVMVWFCLPTTSDPLVDCLSAASPTLAA
jgi:hypothetical protein